MQLDELIRALRDEAAAQPPADEVAGRRLVTRRIRRHRARRLTTMVAVVAALVATSLVVARRGTQETTVRLGDAPAGTLPRGDPRAVHRLAPGPGTLPEGCRPLWLVTDPAREANPAPPFRLDIYARTDPDRSVDERIARDSFALRLGRGRSPASRAARAEYGAADAEVWTGTGGFAAVSPRPEPGIPRGEFTVYSVLSRTMSVARLTELFTSIRLLDHDVVDAVSLPAGYERVASDRSTPYVGYSGMHALSDEGYRVSYRCPGDATAGATITVQRSTRDGLTGVRWALGSEAATIRDRPGTTGTARETTLSGRSNVLPSPPMNVVAWMEDDATLVTIDSLDIDKADLARIAEGLTDDGAAWAALQAGTPGPAGATVAPR
jgi:hypothetical protein